MQAPPILLHRSRRLTLWSTTAVLLWIASAAAPWPAAAGEQADPGPTTEVRYKPNLDAIFSGSEPSNIADLRAMEERVKQLTERLIPTTVSVRVGAAQGSGVIVSPDGYVLTAAHVVGEPNRTAMVYLPDGRRVHATTLGRNKDIDAGMLKITETDAQGNALSWPSAAMGSSSDLHSGQWCLAIGHPGGYQQDRKPVVRFGRILSQEKAFVLTDCTLVGGDSGGPLFDMDGQVIAIHSRIGASLTTNLHVPVNTYRDTWERLAAGQAWGGTPFLGVEADLQDQRAKIASVIPGSAAARGGLQPGDVILQFDDQPVDAFGSLQQLVGNSSPGNKVKLAVLRGEQTLELEIVVGEK